MILVHDNKVFFTLLTVNLSLTYHVHCAFYFQNINSLAEKANLKQLIVAFNHI